MRARSSLMPSPFITTPNPASPWAGSLPPSYSCLRARSTFRRIGLLSPTPLHLILESAMTKNSVAPKFRIDVVDALRGYAIMSILLLHDIEHFDFYFTPEGLPTWVQEVDKIIWESLIFLFAGKSYAIFALLFGLTFFIQLNSQEKQGNDFRLRFAWRLLLLFGFSIINSSFYQGDILMVYALIGFGLIPVARLSNKVVLWIALFLMFQPYEWLNFILSLQHPDMKLIAPISSSYYSKMGEYIPGNSIINTMIGNLTNGRLGTLLWDWENGRVFQILSLFMLGMLTGRKELFAISDENKEFWTKVLIISTIIVVLLHFLNKGLSVWISSEVILQPLLKIKASWSNVTFMFFLISGFVLLYQTSFFHRVLNTLIPLGRMSLSNYVMQSIIGSFIYYGWGLGFYKYTDAINSLFIGLALLIFQLFFCKWWLRHHKQGLLESILHKLTWIKF
jgi:uncharacterized protein